MTYIPEESKVLYRSKDGKKENMFDALGCGWQPCAPIFYEIFPEDFILDRSTDFQIF